MKFNIGMSYVTHMCKSKYNRQTLLRKMQVTNKVVRDLALQAFEMRPNKNANHVTAFVYWWEEPDIIFFDLKHYTGRIVHTSEFNINNIIITTHLIVSI